MFENIRIKDLSDIVNSDTELTIDTDGIVFKIASICDKTSLKVTHPELPDPIYTKNTIELKGQTRAVDQRSILGSLNIKRKATNQRELPFDELVITEVRKTKISLNTAKKILDNQIADLIAYLGIEKYCLILGSGDCFRHELLLPERYKSGRSSSRPLLLDALREHVLSAHPSKLVADEYIEADDYVTTVGFQGYLNYMKTGVFSHIACTNDKDAWSTPSLLFDWSKTDTNYKHPLPWLISHTQAGIGELDLVKGKVRATGLRWLCIQSFLLGDSADGYCPRAVCGKLREHAWGETKIYEELYTIDNPRCLLLFCFDKMKEWYPDGVKYTAWDGTEMDLTIKEWMDILLKCAYMQRRANDVITIESLMAICGVVDDDI